MMQRAQAIAAKAIADQAAVEAAGASDPRASANATQKIPTAPFAPEARAPIAANPRCCPPKPSAAAAAAAAAAS